MSVAKRDQFGNAVRVCDLECGREGTLPLFDGEKHVCLPCAIRASERAIVQRDIKLARAGRAGARPACDRVCDEAKARIGGDMTYIVAAHTAKRTLITTTHAVPNRTRRTCCGLSVDFRKQDTWYRVTEYAIVTCRTCRWLAGFVPVILWE